MQRPAVHTLIAAGLGALVLGAAVAWAIGTAPARAGTDQATDIAAQLAALAQRVPEPELGREMLELQIRHDRLWWAGASANWNLAYYMVSELGEALQRIEQTNGEAIELQPEKLSEVMPRIMDPAIANVQAALARRDPKAFASAYDGLSAACNACHGVAGVSFLHLQRPQTRLLDNLRYAPDRQSQ